MYFVRSRSSRRLDPVRTDRRRSRGVPGASESRRPAVLPHPLRHGVDDARADDPHGRVLQHEVVGASPFPRHWIYDKDGNLAAKSGTVDFKTWYREAHGENTPWGDEESEAFVTAAESALERQLSRELMGGDADLARRKLDVGEILVEQGQPGDELYLVLDGVLVAEVDGEDVGEIGPGAIVGERALLLEGGTRTATLAARTRTRVAVIPAELVDRAKLEDLSRTRTG